MSYSKTKKESEHQFFHHGGTFDTSYLFSKTWPEHCMAFGVPGELFRKFQKKNKHGVCFAKSKGCQRTFKLQRMYP